MNTHRIRAIAVWAGLMLPLGGCIKSVFIDLSYPSEPPEIVPRGGASGQDLSVYATLVPELLADYDQPAAVGACLRELQEPATLQGLLDYGECLSRQGPPAGAEDPRGAAMAACFPRLPFLKPSGREWKISPACAAPREDQLRLASRLAAMGEAAQSYLHAASGGRDGASFRPGVQEGMKKALATASALLMKDPTPAGQNSPSVQRPMLALSGGAANGAFTAGYLHALLSVRELALAELGKQGEKGAEAARRLDAHTRFGGAASTSVGTLIGLPLDLYFSEVDAARLAELEPSLRRCLDTPSGNLGERPVQRCALAFLRREFTERSEHDLLCHEPGTVLSLLKETALFSKPRNHVLRFDPLAKNILAPFLRSYGDVILGNDFQRVAMAIDLQQNVLLGLDERACRMEGIPTEECLGSAVLASIDEPIFTPGEPRVYSGLDPQGEQGLWLDGGLRTGTPVVRALDMTHSPQRVLALNTHRAEGVPHGPYEDAGEVFFGMIDTFVTQTRQWELGHGQLHRVRRNLDLCVVWAHLQMDSQTFNPFRCRVDEQRNVGLMVASPPLLLSGDVFSVFVPEDISPAELYAGGYTFDPKITGGLFAWGQKTFLESRERVLGWLGWQALLDFGKELDDSGYREGLRKMHEEAQAHIAKLEEERRSPDYLKHYKAHVKQRRAEMEKNLKACE